MGFPRSSSQRALEPHGFGTHGFEGGVHAIEGFPEYPGGHLQVATWFTTSQLAKLPHLQGD